MRRSQWILLIALILIIFAVTAFVVGSSTTGQRRAIAQAALDRRVDEAKAEVSARREALQAERTPSSAPPFTSAEIEALNDEMKKAEESGWSELAEEISKIDGAWPPELVAKVKTWLDAHQELLVQARALAERGAFVEIKDYSQETFQEAVSRFGDLRSVVRLLVMAADAGGAEGRLDDAVQLLLDGVSVGDAMGSAPLIATQMTRTASYRAVLDSLERLLPQHGLSGNQLDELERALSHAHQRVQFAAAVANEAQLGVNMFDQIGSSTAGGLLRPLVNMNAASYVENMTNLAGVAAEPYYEGAPQTNDVQRASQDLSFIHYLSRTYLGIVQPVYIRSLEDQARHEARVDMGRIAIALEREYQASGSYPSSLDAVTQYLGGSVPIDPFTGQPFQYRADGAGFTLYSLGSNLTDDGGAEDGRNGDIVWHGGEA
jgi:hypothetical protein